jgi:hypothetical protein
VSIITLHYSVRPRAVTCKCHSAAVSLPSCDSSFQGTCRSRPLPQSALRMAENTVMRRTAWYLLIACLKSQFAFVDDRENYGTSFDCECEWAMTVANGTVKQAHKFVLADCSRPIHVLMRVVQRRSLVGLAFSN